MWVAVGLILRNAWVRSGSDIGRRWTLAAACRALLTDIAVATTSKLGERSTPEEAATRTRPPT